MTKKWRFHHSRRAAIALVAVAGVLLAGCSSLLPHSQTDVSEFKSFEEARAAIESLVPMHSDIRSLAALGIDPMKSSNTTLLTHADIVRRYVPSGVIEKRDLDAGIVACLEARDACRGFDVVASHVATDRRGNFFADFFNFSRRTETSGWRFGAVVLLLNDVVVYRNWGGQPAIAETDRRTNPLGPLQDVGPSTISVPAPIVVR